MFRTPRLLAVFVLASSSACYQQNLKLNVHEDGAGAIKITEKIAVKESALLLESVVPGERDRKLHELLVDELASWSGVAAWSGATAHVEKDAIAFQAKGWFADVRDLRRDGVDGLTHTFGLTDENGTETLTWRFARRAGPAPDTLARCRAIVASLKETRIEATVTLPNALMSDEVAEEPGYSTATWVLFSGAELDAKLQELEARLEVGATTEEDVVREIRASLERTLTVRCRTGETTAARDAFRRALEHAKHAYSGSELEKDVERARLAHGPREEIGAR